MEVWEKSETIDPEVRAYVHSLVNAVGGQSTVDDRYAVGDDAPAVLQDLVRWIRLYDDKLDRLDVKRCLAEANLVKGDLLEILALWKEDEQESKAKAKLALACLQLLVPLTWPIELEEDKTTVNHHRHQPYLLLAHVFYKRSILHFEDAEILRTAIRVGLPSMMQERRERSRRDEGIIKMILYFFRNVAMITQPQQLPSQGDENEISRSATIEAFEQQDVFSYLLTVGSGASDEYQEQDVILLEILYHLLKGVSPRKLFMEKEQLQSEGTNELEMLMRKERSMHKGYNKHAPTRHNRFGTVIWVKRDDEKVSTVSGQNTITNEGATFDQMDLSKRWNKPKYRGKMTEETAENLEFSNHVDLTDDAVRHLRSFVENFLDSSFNPLFAAVRKDIERDIDKVSTANRSQYFYLISWFLEAERARRDAAGKSQATGNATQAEPVENTFAYIAAVLDQETFVLLNRKMQIAFDEKRWTELQATLLCFTQILLTVQSMAESEDEEDQEIAENIQNRIFYEEATHDRMVQVLRGYSTQGFAYLNIITESVHVFVRMLERYSKQNVDLQVRSKRRARKKKKQQTQPGENGGEGDANQDNEDAEEDEHDAQLTVRERKFDFARFSAKFLTQPCVDTFLALLRFYTDLNADQLKRCHRYLYRLAFKHELAILLFRVDVLQLFHRMIKGPQSLSTELESYKEWEQLVQQIFRRCIKWVERETEGDGWRAACFVEMLFSKIPNTTFFLQNGYERVVEKRPPRPPAELALKASVKDEFRIPVATVLMIDNDKWIPMLWVKEVLEKAVEERRAWRDQQQATTDDKDGSEAQETTEAPAASPPTIFLIPDCDDRKVELFKDKHLRLLLETVGCQRLGLPDDADASWIIPSEVTLEQLENAVAVLAQSENGLTEVYAEYPNLDSLVRNKSSVRQRGVFSDSESGGDDDDNDGDVDEAMFPPNLREKRKQTEGEDGEARQKKKRRLTRRNQTELTEEELNERAADRRRREKQRNLKIKSQLFVTASDDESDEEADAEFFRLEAERRKNAANAIKKKLLEEGKRREQGLLDKKAKKNKTKNKQSTDDVAAAPKGVDADVDDDDDADMRLYTGGLDVSAEESENEDELAPSRSAQPRHRKRLDSDESEEDAPSSNRSTAEDAGEEDTPSTSPTPVADKVLGEVSGNAGVSKARGQANDDADMDDEGDDGPVVKPSQMSRRNVRAGFIIDDSDSE